MIVDTHIHIYDPTRPQGVPFPEKGDVLYRRVLPEDYKKLAVPKGGTDYCGGQCVARRQSVGVGCD